MKKKLKANIYIDGANLFYAQKKLGWSIDHKRMIDLYKKKYEVIQSIYYTGVNPQDLKMKKYLRHLDKVNIIPVTKPLKKIKTGKNFILKSNFDVEMTMDILLERHIYDICILVSGDSDFTALAKKLQDFGKKVHVISTRNMISWELKLSSDIYDFIEDYKDTIKKTSSTREE